MILSSPIAPTGRAGQRTARREQLLDTAAELVVERGGTAGFTMEGLAARAGVSKALPYRHFANAEAAIVALYHRETEALGRRIVAATRGHAGDQLVRLAVHAFFDVVEERGALLNVLAGPGSPVPELVEGKRQAPQFLAELLHQAYGTRGRTALVLASIVAGLVTAGTDSWGRGDAGRLTVERITTDAAIGAVHAVVERERR